MAKPKVFIGSSTEALPLARAVELHLRDCYDTTLWKHGVFNPGEVTIEALEKVLDEHSFAVLILTPDDRIMSRGRRLRIPRDNILLELGLFAGRLGRKRAFVMCDPRVIQLPSNWLGVTVAPFDWRKVKRSHNVQAEISPACTEVLDAMAAALSSPPPCGPCVHPITNSEFFRQIDLSTVRELDILCHTGRSLFESFNEHLAMTLANRTRRPGRIRVLTRAPLAERGSRNQHITATVAQVRAMREQGLNIDIRFYESIPAIRGVLCRRYDGTQIGFTSGYYWPKPNTSKAWNLGFVATEGPGQVAPENGLLEKWFEHCWGRDEIHTVVFDFDDTLVSTGKIQVKAWVQAISECIESRSVPAERLSPQLRRLVSKSRPLAENRQAYEVLKNVFIRRQLAEGIIQDLFVGLPDDALRQINQRRFQIREALMSQATVFDGVPELLQRLGKRYNFAIISSTDEQMIADYLKDKGLMKHFPIILGKNDPALRSEKESIYKKSWLLIKLSGLIGVPLSRLVYVGDNDSDRLAARQLGVAFIEARQAAVCLRQTSFLSRTAHLNGGYIGSFASFKHDSLPTLLRGYSERLGHDKFRLNGQKD